MKTTNRRFWTIVSAVAFAVAWAPSTGSGQAPGASGAQIFTNRAEFEAALGSFIVESFENAPLNGNIEQGSVGAVETLELPYFTLEAEPRAIEILEQDTPFGPSNTTPGGSRYLGFDTSGYFSGIDGELEFLLKQPVFAFGLDYTSHHPENTTAHFRVYGTGDTFIGNFRLRPDPIPLNAPQDGFWGIISPTPIAGLEFDAGDADAIWGVDEVTWTSIPVLACPCDGPADGESWRNRGEYLGCVRDAARSMVIAGQLSNGQQKDVLKSAAASECGNKMRED
jgi:hypothetical protein